MGAQIDLLDEIIVDNFAGGGGASTGDQVVRIILCNQNGRMNDDKP